jgi:hypothetical protein
MARIRSVKPDVFRHEALYEAEQATQLPLRLAFIALWTACDREGRFKWAPRQLKLDCLPYDDIDFTAVLDALATRGFVVRYACGTGDYGVIPSWSKHQVINNREARSSLPEPPKYQDVGPTMAHVEDALATRAPRVRLVSPTPLVHAPGEGKGREEEGKGSKSQNPTSSSVYDAACVEDEVREKRREEARDFTAKVVRAFERAGQTRHPITKLAYDWMLLPGFDFNAAIYIIEAELSRPGLTKDIGGLNFFESQIIAKYEAKRRGYVGSAGAISTVASTPGKLVAREDAVCEGDKPLPDVTAHNMIDLWECGGPWAPPLGMRPDQHGCRVPMDILQARGYRDDAGRMSDRYLELRAEARAKRDLVRNSVQPIPKSTNGAQHP